MYASTDPPDVTKGGLFKSSAHYLHMAMCFVTVLLGLAILILGIGGSVTLRLFPGIKVSGVVGGVVLVLGVLGFGC